MAGTRICIGAAIICWTSDHTVAGNALLGSAIIFGAAEVAVTAAQSDRISDVARATKDRGLTMRNLLASSVNKVYIAGYSQVFGNQQSPHDAEKEKHPITLTAYDEGTPFSPSHAERSLEGSLEEHD